MTQWTKEHQASLSFTISQSLLKLMSIELVMPSNHLILSPPSPTALYLSHHQGVFQSIGSLHQVVKYWSFSFSNGPSSEYSGLILWCIWWRQQGQIGYSNRCNNNISQHNMLTLILAVGGNYEGWELSASHSSRNLSERFDYVTISFDCWRWFLSLYIILQYF